MMTSLLSNKKADEEIVFHIIDGKISDLSKQTLNKIEGCSIVYHAVDSKIFEKYKQRQYYSVTVLWRLLLPKLVNVDKIIFLDCDLVVNSSLSELWDIDLGENYVAAVEDPNSVKYSKRYKLKNPHEFFNAGVLVINCKKWLEEDIPDRSVKIAMDNVGNELCCDQTILNILFEGQVKFLDLRWNVQYSPFNVWPGYKNLKKYKMAIKNPAIIHFTGDFKPWKQGFGCFCPFEKVFLKYHKKTTFAFKDYKKWQIIDKLRFYRAIFAFVKRYPVFFLKKQFWWNFIFMLRLALISS